jgi:polysaccharide export outer membrane protein
MIRLKINFDSIITLVLLFLLSGCVTQREMEYLQKDGRTPKSFKEADVSEYKLRVDDELYIQVTSLDEAADNILQTSGNQLLINSGSIQPYGVSLVSYTVNKKGFLSLPIIGVIYVKDRSLPEVREIIIDSLANILNQPSVTIKLVNRYISVLGEVRNPGHFPYAQDKLTIFNAIGAAGDMTKFANRKEVLLTRNENGANLLITVDLTKPDVLESSYYYLRPNDVIYVKPLKKRVWGTSEFPFSLILSTLTFTLLFYSVVN